MMNVNDVRGKLNVYGTDDIVVTDENQCTDEIIRYIIYAHKLEKPEYDAISNDYWKDNVRDTAKYLFDFLKKNVKYKEEPEDFQTVRSPGMILKMGHGDCKHYALYINGVVDSLRQKGYPIKCKYRFVADTPYDRHGNVRDVHHVFAVVSDDTGTDYWDDPVVGSFNKKPVFYNTKDYKMAVHYLRGTVNGTDKYAVATVGNIFDKFKHAMDVNFENLGHSVKVNAANITKGIQIATDQVKHAAVVNAANLAHGVQVNTANLTHGIQVNAANLAHGMQVNAANVAHGVNVNAANLAHGIQVNAKNLEKGAEIALKDAKMAALKVSMLAARKAFLSLVALNVHAFATDLHTADQNALRNKWEGIGGEWKVLDQAIHNGMGRKMIFGLRDTNTIGIFGVDDAAIATWLALASIVIGLLSQFLKHKNPAAAASTADAAAALNTAAAITGQMQDGTGNILAAAYQSTLSPQQQQADALNNLVQPTNNTGTMAITPGVTDDGTPQVTVHDINTPFTDDGTVTDAQGNVIAPQNNVNSAPGAFDIAFGKLMAFVVKYKEPIIAITTGGLVVYAISNRKPRKRR